MTQQTNDSFSYDQIPYTDNPFAATHPDRLATQATLLGISPPPINSCRVLELGCGRGGNLIPMAEQLPGSEFVGVDLSAVQINEANQLASDADITNVKLEHRDIMDIGEADGVFDYIICHGVYSWVPPQVQDKILQICKQNLSGSGVAFVSYNVYPGWHLRRCVRDIMMHQAERFNEPHEKIRQARGLLQFVGKHTPGSTPYAALLGQEINALKQHDDSYVFHEHLSEYNEPLYFREFCERAGQGGMQYLGEASFGSMVNPDLPSEIFATVQHFADGDILTRRTVFRSGLQSNVSTDAALPPRSKK